MPLTAEQQALATSAPLGVIIRGEHNAQQTHLYVGDVHVLSIVPMVTRDGATHPPEDGAKPEVYGVYEHDPVSDQAKWLYDGHSIEEARAFAQHAFANALLHMPSGQAGQGRYDTATAIHLANEFAAMYTATPSGKMPNAGLSGSHARG